MGLKLYVWENPYRVSYGMSLVFAVATNVADARKQAAAGQNFSYCMTNPAGIKLGKPTRVTPVPCAEWHEWSE